MHPNPEACWPNLLIVGAAKSGTTTLHYALAQHPDVFMSPKKEPGYFTWPDEPLQFINNGRLITQPRFLVNRQSDYLQLFAPGCQRRYRGESSTTYLFFYEKTIANIRRLHPDPDGVRIVIALRNPVERAFSQYMHKVRDGAETLSFEEALQQEAWRREHNWHFDYSYLERGFYYRQVKAYRDHFPHVHILLFDDLRNDPAATLLRVQEFLGLPAVNLDAGGELNVSGRPRILAVNRFLKRKNKVKELLGSLLPAALRRRLRLRVQSLVYRHNLERETLPADLRRQLIDVYRTEVEQLQGLLQRDLSSWLR
ncbi:MAG: sulfotransferase [Chitinophagales bacterium]|nr:sulfotransferase [Chitinophagales bacterium]MDW8393572.1 sulfotransferase [Chitinophagales bacterium]